MRSSLLIGACLAALFCLGNCRQRAALTGINTRADSLLRLTLELQARLGSSDIQRMHDFKEEIDQDLTILDSTHAEESSVTEYRELSGKLEQCMKACSQYHEEAFMIESSLREIKDLAGDRDQDPGELEKRLEFETDNYTDLVGRVDSSMARAMRRAEEYYSMKPGINRILDEYRLP